MDLISQIACVGGVLAIIYIVVDNIMFHKNRNKTKWIIITLFLLLPFKCNKTDKIEVSKNIVKERNYKDLIDSIEFNQDLFRNDSQLNNIKRLKPVFEFIRDSAKICIELPIVFFIAETGTKSRAFLQGFNMGGVMTNGKVRKYKSLYYASKDWIKVLSHPRYKHNNNIPFIDKLQVFHKANYWGDNIEDIRFRFRIYNQIKNKLNFI